jgi:hypothetical protein
MVAFGIFRFVTGSQKIVEFIKQKKSKKFER